MIFFGLTNSSATLQLMMDTIFRVEILQGWLKVYMDDLLICGTKENRDELVARGRHILQMLQENNLFVYADKCLFFSSKVEFLGFIIEEGHVKMDDAKVDGIAKWPPPETVMQLWSFLGFCNYYHQFIDYYSDKCQPLNMLLQMSRLWDWTPIQHAAFENLKVAFISKLVLLMPDYLKPFKMECNKSLFATRGVLL